MISGVQKKKFRSIIKQDKNDLQDLFFFGKLSPVSF